MTLNPPPKVRATLYILSAVGNPTIAYLFSQGKVDSFWFGLWTVISVAVFALAGINVTSSINKEEG